MSHNNFLNHDEKDRKAWQAAERKLRRKLFGLLSIILIFIVLIIWDVLYFKSVIVSIISTSGSILAIIDFIEKKNN